LKVKKVSYEGYDKDAKYKLLSQTIPEIIIIPSVNPSSLHGVPECPGRNEHRFLPHHLRFASWQERTTYGKLLQMVGGRGTSGRGMSGHLMVLPPLFITYILNEGNKFHL